MNTYHLRSFQAVSQLLSFRQAAKRLNISQSALSLQIQKLEEDLGTELLERDRNSVRLTAAGEELRSGIPNLFAHAEFLRQQTRSAGVGESGVLRVGFVSSAAILVLPRLIKALRQRHPGIRLDVRHATTGEQIDALLDGSLDAGILRVPLTSGLDRLTIRHVLEEPLWVLIPAGHKLLERQPIRVEDLRDHDHVMASSVAWPAFHAELMQLLVDKGAVPSHTHEVQDMYSIIVGVAGNMGIAIVPRSISLFRFPGVVAKPLSGRLPKARLALAVRKDQRGSFISSSFQTRRKPALRSFEELCKFTFEQQAKAIR